MPAGVYWDYQLIENYVYPRALNGAEPYATMLQAEEEEFIRVFPEERIHVVVADSGVGISRDKLERIFERRFQVERETGKPTEGSGLGLSIVQRIVEIHQAKLTLSTSPHGGLQVKVWFKTAPNDIETT